MRLFDGPVLTRALAAPAALVLVFALLVANPAALRADDIDDGIKAVKELEKAGADKEDECIAKMLFLRAGRDPRAFAALKEMIGSKSDRIACAAVSGLAVGWQDPEYFRWLLGRVDDKTLYSRESGRPEVYKCVLESIRTYPPGKVKAALKPLGDAVNRFLATEPEYADRAIRAYGTVPDRFTVQQLLDWLDQTAASPDGKGSGKSGGKGDNKGESKEARENKDKARQSILETLTALCGKDAGDAGQWRKWWAENGKTFKFPEAAKGAAGAGKPAKPAAPMADPSGLSEFKDEAYGWSVKKPEQEYWKFFKPDYDGPRVGLLCLPAGTDAYNMARAYISVHDPAKFEPKDIKSFAAWAVAKIFKEQFDTDTMPAPPATKEMNIGGVDWTVVVARGLATGQKAGWGTIERRFYLTKLDPYILYVDAYVRLNADNEDKEAFWKCIEGIVLPAPAKK